MMHHHLTDLFRVMVMQKNKIQTYTKQKTKYLYGNNHIRRTKWYTF